MSNSIILPDEFNTIKQRLTSECYRRSINIADKGNQYNNNAFTIDDFPIINFDAIQNNIITTDMLNAILNILNKFNVFPEAQMHISYQDGVIYIGDYIYTLSGFLELIQSLESENRVNNNDCKTGCMGLCTNTCNNACTGCTDVCTGSCSNTCTAQCNYSCSGGCTKTCKNSCTGGCTASGGSTWMPGWGTPESS